MRRPEPKCGCSFFGRPHESKKLIQIERIPSKLGTSAEGQPYAPHRGMYQDRVVYYYADGAVYLYDSDGDYVALNEAASTYTKDQLDEMLGEKSAVAAIGSGAPTSSIIANNIGQPYYDTVNQAWYLCSAITPQGTTPETYMYTWEKLATAGDVDALDDRVDNLEDAQADIYNYLSTKVAHVYENVAAMKADAELSSGMLANVLGNKTENDGEGSFWKIRNREDGDAEDYNTILIGDDLTAIRINKYAGKTTKKLGGTYDNACINNINNTGIRAQVMGISTPSGLATYANRDHVNTYKEMRTQTVEPYAIVSTTATSVTLNTAPTYYKVGSIIDLYADDTYNKNAKYSGFITEVNGNVVTVSGWYYTNNTDPGQIPSGVTIAVIDKPTKVWVENANLIIQDSSKVYEGVIAEYGVFGGSSARANGIDMINFNGRSDFAFQARSDIGNVNNRFSVGFFANGGCQQALLSRDCDYLFRAELNGDERISCNKYGGIDFATDADEVNFMIRHHNQNFVIDGNGLIKHCCASIKQYNASGNINPDDAYIHQIVTGYTTFNLSTGRYGQIINIVYRVSAGQCSIVFNGMTGVLTPGKSAQLYYDGSTWQDLNNVIVWS